MAVLTPQILFGKVMHKRLFPQVNGFTYGIYYVVLPLSKISKAIENNYLKLNRWGLLSFYNKDHGNRDGQNLQHWAKNILNQGGIDKADGEIILITMPRVFGYVFNPVSFWLCYDKNKILRAVICEVNNTFGETHSYLCAHEDQSEITQDDILQGQKVFHVSPFLRRDGGYHFRFSDHNNKFGVWIDYYDGEGKKKLLTALTGHYVDLTKKSCGRAFWRYPLITFKAIFLIHWQAVKLFFKKAEYVPKPKQKEPKLTAIRKKLER